MFDLRHLAVAASVVFVVNWIGISHEATACPITASPSWKNSITFPGEPFRHTPQQGDVGWVKFAILTCDPTTVYFQNSNTYLFHHEFATSVLDPFVGMSLEEFNAVSLNAAGQQVILGTVIYPPGTGLFGATPLAHEFGIQFVRDDAYSAQEVITYFDLVRNSVSHVQPVDAFYFPTQAQMAAATADAAELGQAGITISSTNRWADGNACYAEGWALGTLKYFSAGEIEDAFVAGALLPEDILLTDGVPAEIPSVAGVISLAPSTPNSHVAILSRTFGLPFAHTSIAQDADRAISLIGRRIVFRAYGSTTNCDLRLIDVEDQLTPTQVDEILQLKTPPALNITPTSPHGAFTGSVETLGPADVDHFGGKASNFGILRRAIPNQSPKAAAISFDFWQAYLDLTVVSTGNTLRQEIASKLAGHTYPPDMLALSNDLDDLRDLIKDDDELVMTPAMEGAILAMLEDPQFGFDLNAKIRFRSSTNVEDSEQFTGAGLYDSKSGCYLDDTDADTSGPSHCDPTESAERGVFRAIRRVFESFYNDNAYLERLRHGVNEADVGMAILVHHSFPDEFELANGVATLTKDANGIEVTLVTQAGAVSVTNPDSGAIPEEVRYFVFAPGNYARSHVTPSNLVQLGAEVMDWTTDYDELTGLLLTVADQFELETGKSEYILDFEYKKMSPGGAAQPAGGIVVKQVRELPQPDVTPSITPFLVNEPIDYTTGPGQGHQGVVSDWRIETKNMWLTDANLAADSILSDVEILFSDGCGPAMLAGPMASLPNSTHAYDDSARQTTDSWRLDELDNPRTYSLTTHEIGGLVAPSESPILTLRDFGNFNGAMTLQLEFDAPVPNSPGQPPATLLRFAGLAPTKQDVAAIETSAFYVLPDDVTISMAYRIIPNTSGICCFATQVESMELTTIEGLTSEPIVLTSTLAHSISYGQHNWDTTAIVEPLQEPGLSPQTRDELLALDIGQIRIFRSFIGWPDSDTFYTIADLGLSCDPCAYGLPGDLNGDQHIDGLDIARFGEVLVHGPTGPSELCVADMNEDDSVDVGDVPLLVERLLAGS